MTKTLRGILPGSWDSPEGKTINTTKVYVDFEGNNAEGLIGNQCAELKYDGDISKIKSFIGKHVNLDFMPSGKTQKLVDITLAG